MDIPSKYFVSPSHISKLFVSPDISYRTWRRVDTTTYYYYNPEMIL